MSFRRTENLNLRKNNSYMLSHKIEFFDSIEFNKRVLFIVWILVLCKCLILEYYIQDLMIPINSAFLIWSLSLGLTSTASYLFFKKSDSFQLLQDEKLNVRVTFNLTIFLVLALLNSTNFILDYLNWAYLMATNFSLLGIYFIANGLLKFDKWKFVAGSYLLIASVFISQCEFLNVYLYSSFLLIILAIQLIIDLIYYRKTSISME